MKKTDINSHYQKNSFTLVELVLYIAIFSILLIVLTDIFSSVLDVRLESETTSKIVLDGRFLLSRLIYDINRAQNIVTPAALGNQTNTLQLTINGMLFTYNLNLDNIELTNNEGINNLNSLDTKVSDLNFKRLGNVGGKNTIRINFTLSSNTLRKSGPEIKNFQTTVGLR